MASLAELRAKYPQYDDMDDSAFADAFYRKFYSDMPRDQFDAKLGIHTQSETPSGWTPQADADLAEKISGTGTFADMTGSGIAKAVPFGDEIASGLNAIPRAAREWYQGNGFDIPRAYDRNMQVEAELQRRRDERSPIASTAGAVVGGVGASAPLAAGGLSFLNGAKPTLLSMAGRGAAEGAAYGAAYGAGEGRGLNDRLFNATTGAGVGALAGGATGAIGSIGAGKVDTSALPTADDLKAAAQSAYQRADDAGVIYSKDAMSRIRDALMGEYADFGYHPELQSGAKVALNEVGRLADENVTLKGLDTARKIAGNAYQPGNKANNALASKVTSAIDDLIANPQAGDILAGNGAEAAQAIKEARGLYRQAAKLETVNKLMDRAGLNAGSSGAGANIENATRQQLKRLLTSETMGRGFTKAELDATRRAVLGTPGQNALRYLGKFAPTGVVPGGIGVSTGATVGGWLGGPAGAAVGSVALPAVGMGAKMAADAGSRTNARMLEALIANGGELPSPAVSAIRQQIIEALTHGAAVAAQ